MSKLILGYACQTLGLPEGRFCGVTKKNASSERLAQTIEHNLSALRAVFEYCHTQNIHLFRIGSGVIPFGSSEVNELHWRERIERELVELGSLAKRYDIRLSMHPGQYTVLNSPRECVVQNAIRDLEYHVAFLDALQLDARAKVILHIGGVYDDKAAAKKRFINKAKCLSEAVLNRLIIENDDQLYTAEDVLQISGELHLPTVFDVLHHRLNHEGESSNELALIDACAATWKARDGRPKLHYSQQAVGKRLGSHSATIKLTDFLCFISSLAKRSCDIMLEVKDKNASTVKCQQALCSSASIRDLEQSWAKYKYTVLEHDQHTYLALRTLLKNKSAYPVQEFYTLIEGALEHTPSKGSARNAAQHVWGYFSKTASARERSTFEKLLTSFEQGTSDISAVKRRLATLAARCDETYLLHSYYFDL